MRATKRRALAVPARLNGVLACALHACNALGLFALPALLLPRHRAWGLLLVPLAVTSNALWSLVHEAIHGLLLPGARGNRALGRLLAVVFGGALDVFRVVHLMHHKFN